MPKRVFTRSSHLFISQSQQYWGPLNNIDKVHICNAHTGRQKFGSYGSTSRLNRYSQTEAFGRVWRVSENRAFQPQTVRDDVTTKVTTASQEYSEGLSENVLQDLVGLSEKPNVKHPCCRRPALGGN